mgnify:CR=1 FL=1
MNIYEVEILAKKTAMVTGKDQIVITCKGSVAFQPADKPVPDGWEIHARFSHAVTGVAGGPTFQASKK